MQEDIKKLSKREIQNEVSGSISEIARLLSEHQFKLAAERYANIDSTRVAKSVISKLTLSCNRDLLILFFRIILKSDIPQDRAATVALQLSRFYLTMNMVASSLRCIWPFRRLHKRFEGRLTPIERRNIDYQIAQCLNRNNRLAEGERVLRGILLFDPGDVDVLLALASISRQNPNEYLQLVHRAVEASQGSSFRAISLYLDRLLDLGRNDEFEVVLSRFFKAHANRPDVFLILANRELLVGSTEGYRLVLGRYFDSYGLMRPSFCGNGSTGFLDLDRTRHRKTEDGPKVSVVMTSHNSAEYIRYAISSVLDQSYKNIELHVVDDCSSDNSCDIVMQFAHEDTRVKLHRTQSNVGTYVAKNSAIDECAGTYITFHDSDDWMHPERIARYVKKMGSDPNLVCVTSDWVRLDWEGRAILRKTGGFSHLNPASTMYTAAALQRHGRFDEVRAGADSELMWRIRRNEGQGCISHLKEPLGFGLHRDDSLTMNSVTGFDENRYSRVRLVYWESWSAWHLKKIARQKPIRLRRGVREFPAPDALRGAPDGPRGE